MRILLIFPDVEDNLDIFSAPSFMSSLLKPLLGFGTTNMVAPLSLMMLAAVTPEEHEVRLVDERFEKVDFNEPADLVGITVITKTAYRSYKIADQFLSRGVKVVLGGIHPTVLPHEAAEHASSVVIGEGENAWLEVLSDLKKNKLKKFYHGGRQNDPSLFPWPRRDILPHPGRYLTNKIILATRGCVNNCAFCSSGAAVGRKYRMRNIDDILEEIKSIPGVITHFLDDNIAGNIAFSKKLFRALIPLGIKWDSSFTVSALEDGELLDLMAESGCVSLDAGFESLSPDVIAGIKKGRTNQVGRYRSIIREVHRRGITLYGNFIVGFDQDGPDVFGNLVRFIEETNIEVPFVNILMPYPGSALHNQFDREGRLLHKNWNHYDDTSSRVVYRPKLMSPGELVDGFIKLICTVHAVPAYFKRVVKAGTWRNFTGSLAGFHMNLQKRKVVRSGLKNRERCIESKSSC